MTITLRKAKIYVAEDPESVKETKKEESETKRFRRVKGSGVAGAPEREGLNGTE